jgi:hypothetical protein
MWPPPHKLVRPPCSYYWLQEIKKREFVVVSNGTIFIPDFIKICLLVLELGLAGEGTQTVHVYFMHIVQRIYNNNK